MHTYDSMQVGDTFSLQRFISKEDVQGFADVTGDDNPLHVDEEYAAGTRFGHTVVHGVLLLGIVSKVLGRDYPGHGSIAVSITAKFLRPVPVGSEIEIQVKVVEKIERHKHVRLKVYAYREGKMAVGGEAVVIPPSEEV
jgi:3-hydroxybutyryl-CoA dehydratase